ncbi:putative membrane protein [Caulobacter sp. AP07]|uniref:heparan-alpha-glucosaminide N-acetyltransferase domain-containing protein n=1 Tax=Caulobacter sp. AP07 TaxID=1144304 RepID=UPI000271F747|nr:heparan-alpha-glucosaminide N-acetyltransferase domain-containing protein [Caulobacter sp. AP07]EJL35594.1 putative membrane protein [Caulobacter sp. AP07]
MNLPENGRLQDPPARLEGLDLARCLALLGMVIVNFSIAMGADAQRDPGLLAHIEHALQGRAAATFVTLAGLGLGLAARRAGHAATLAVTAKRSAFLLIAGLLNTLLFPADILHYYAVFFLLGALCLRLPGAALVALMLAVTIAAVTLILRFDYNAGWNWETFDYPGFWTATGFLRNLVFNGFHPVFPWFAFFLFGLVLSRLALDRRRVQWLLVAGGAAGLALSGLLGEVLGGLATRDAPRLAPLLTTAPLPPMPLFVLAGCGAAALVTGSGLILARQRFRAALAPLMATGRQTLTLYIAHILLGMGTLEALGRLGGQRYVEVAVAVAVFCGAAVAYAVVWSRFFKRGPAEMLMRRLAG